MAKKENENEFEDLNDGGDINEADDSFGLPEINYKPLDETEPDEPVEETSSVEEQETPVEDQPYMYAQRADEEPAGESDFEVSSSETTDSQDNIFGEPDRTDEVETVTSEESTEEKEYVPGSYTPKHTGGSNTGAIIGIIFLILLVAAAIWWFAYESPRRDEIAEQTRIEQEEQARIRQEQQAREAAERQRQQEEAARLAEEERLAAEQQSSEPGTIETISQRTGRYYVIVTSSIDGDLAMDYAKDLAADGNSVKIIAPYGNVKFHRVAVTDVETLADAEVRANELKGQYGDGVWVMKY